jgi:hypothetical protein
MLKVQHRAGGGVLGYVAEHGGDVVHRMNENFKHASGVRNNPDELRNAIEVGRQMVLSKTKKVLSYLKSNYGFAREHAENMSSNARFNNVPAKEYERRLNDALKVYADQHRKLPSYNRPQLLANKAAVAIGEQDWAAATKYYEQLNKLANDAEAYHRAMNIDKVKK